MLLTIAILCSLAGTAGVVMAQTEAEIRAESTTTLDLKRKNASTTLEKKAEVRAKIDAKQDIREEKKEARIASTTLIRENNKERRQDLKARVGVHIRKINKNHAEVIVRLQKISARIESRINKLEGKGRNLDTAEALLATANIKIDAAETARVAAAANITAALAVSPFTAVEAQKIKNEVRETEKRIREAHRALIDTLRAIKSSVKVEATATTTAN